MRSNRSNVVAALLAFANDAPAQQCSHDCPPAERDQHGCCPAVVHAARPQSAATHPDVLGSRWTVTEGPWTAVWTRRGTTPVFDAVFSNGGQQVTADVLIDTESGMVTAIRRNSDDSAWAVYVGTIGNDHASASGVTVVSERRLTPWRAEVVHPASGAGGGRWSEFENGWSGDWVQRGATDVFDATWTRPGTTSTVTAQLTIHTTGHLMIVHRTDPNGNVILYVGTFSADRGVGFGVAQSAQTPTSWRATISP